MTCNCLKFIGEEVEAVIRNVTSEMFETTGNPYKRAEWGTERDFEMAGLMVAHSILQGGPGLSCLPPVLYAFIISGSDDCLLDEFPRLEDVPRSAATYDLIELCEKV